MKNHSLDQFYKYRITYQTVVDQQRIVLWITDWRGSTGTFGNLTPGDFNVPLVEQMLRKRLLWLPERMV